MWSFEGLEWEAVTALATVLYTIATAVIAWIAWHQLSGLRAQAEQAQTSSDAHIGALQQQLQAMQQQVEISEASRRDSFRPLITLSELAISPAGNMQVGVKNIGPGPARHVRVLIGYHPVTGELSAPTSEGPTRAVLQMRTDPVTFLVGDVGPAETKFRQHTVEEDFRGVNLAIAARFAYEDIFSQQRADPLPAIEPHLITSAVVVDD